MEAALKSSGDNLLTRAGIDEAGFGPLLGPLVVSCAAFSGRPDSSLARAFPRARRQTGAGLIRIDDSKAVFTSGRSGFETLERTVLAFAAQRSGKVPRSGSSFLAEVAPGRADGGRSVLPWYPLEDLELPLKTTAAEAERAALRVREALAKEGLAQARFVARVVTEDALNEGFLRTGNKATFLASVVADHLPALASGEGRTNLAVDRLGGRKSYSDFLASCFPMELITILGEARELSEYEIPLRRLSVSFSVRGEERDLEVALASMLSKYVREVYMAAFNRFWSARRPGIRPTEGYVEDGRRFISDLRGEPFFESVGASALVRMR